MNDARPYHFRLRYIHSGEVRIVQVIATSIPDAINEMRKIWEHDQHVYSFNGPVAVKTRGYCKTH